MSVTVRKQSIISYVCSINVPSSSPLVKYFSFSSIWMKWNFLIIVRILRVITVPYVHIAYQHGQSTIWISRAIFLIMKERKLQWKSEGCPLFQPWQGLVKLHLTSFFMKFCLMFCFNSAYCTYLYRDKISFHHFCSIHVSCFILWNITLIDMNIVKLVEAQFYTD